MAIPLVESRSVFLWLPLIDPSSNAGPHGTNPNDLSHYMVFEYSEAVGLCEWKSLNS